ncbi:uncharacterized protein LOC103097845 isoform X2 [Monodelphis domestica]|uniref:uncharacterized protein LOC103097845 isoform X2 n=1 Tax=Monodelphis domestica TaxID=13616 RepID=UPI0004431B45|nr:uncharacterized protein LOC103097845 isoform X2 [Monodelphis domestica]
MDPRMEAIVALIELVRRLGVGHGPTKGELDNLCGGEGDLRGKSADGKALMDHTRRPAPRARSPSARSPTSLVRDLGALDGAVRTQEAKLRPQSNPGHDSDPRSAGREPPPRSPLAGAPTLRDHIEKLAKNQCALHEAQKSLQQAVRDLSRKVDTLARTIPTALHGVTSSQTDLGKNLNHHGSQLSSVEYSLDRFQARTNTAGQPDIGPVLPGLSLDGADLYPSKESY